MTTVRWSTVNFSSFKSSFSFHLLFICVSYFAASLVCLFHFLSFVCLLEKVMDGSVLHCFFLFYFAWACFLFYFVFFFCTTSAENRLWRALLGTGNSFIGIHSLGRDIHLLQYKSKVGKTWNRNTNIRTRGTGKTEPLLSCLY